MVNSPKTGNKKENKSERKKNGGKVQVEA